jgi:hypothetical protein
MNIFIKFKEKKKLILIKDKNISVLDLIEKIKNEITPKDEIKIEIKNFDFKLFFQKKQLSKEKKLREYNIQNNDEIDAEISEKDVYSYSVVKEKQFLCNFCFSLLKDPIQLKCEHFYCNNCFDYLNLFQNIDIKPNQLQKNIKIEKCNSIKCLVCNKINEKNENQSNSNKLKQKIESYLNEKKKVEVVICDNETDDGEECSNDASIRCDECKGNFCEECSKKIHFKKLNKNHKFGKMISKCFYFLFF